MATFVCLLRWTPKQNINFLIIVLTLYALSKVQNDRVYFFRLSGFCYFWFYRENNFWKSRSRKPRKHRALLEKKPGTAITNYDSFISVFKWNISEARICGNLNYQPKNFITLNQQCQNFTLSLLWVRSNSSLRTLLSSFIIVFSLSASSRSFFSIFINCCSPSSFSTLLALLLLLCVSDAAWNVTKAFRYSLLWCPRYHSSSYDIITKTKRAL